LLASTPSRCWFPGQRPTWSGRGARPVSAGLLLHTALHAGPLAQPASMAACDCVAASHVAARQPLLRGRAGGPIQVAVVHVARQRGERRCVRVAPEGAGPAAAAAERRRTEALRAARASDG